MYLGEVTAARLGFARKIEENCHLGKFGDAGSGRGVQAFAEEGSLKRLPGT